MTIQEIANALNIKIGTIDALKMYIGSAVIWEPQVIPEDGLPAGYTELEYISSTSGGNQYIDLGIKLYENLNTDYDIAMKFNIDSGNANQAALFACQDSDNDPWPGTFVGVSSSTNTVIGRYIGGSAKDNTIGSIGSDLEIPVQTTPNKNVTSLNNNNTTHQYGTSLFCAFVGGTNTPDRYCNAKLYYFKLFVNGTLVRDLIPCKNSSNVVGMYDLINRVFYTSPNNAAFVAGPEVIKENYVTNGLIFHLDGINKGTGADWVDLIGGIQLNLRTGYECTSTLNSWSFPGNNNYYLSSANGAWSSIGGSDDFTVEVCYNNLNNSARTFLFGFGGNYTSKYPIFYHDGTYITWMQSGYTYNASSMTGNAKYTVSLNNNSGLVNGQTIQKTSSTDYWDVDHTDIRIGSASSGGAAGAPAKGDIYSIRIYNRRLSQSEQLQNQRVDNIRFNLGLSLPSPQATPTYSLLDILYSDSSGNLSVDSQVLPTSEGKTPIALCIAGTNFFGDNEPARWMSLKYMSCNTPDSGTLIASSGYMMWGNNGLDISTIDDITTIYNGGSNDGYLTASWSNKTSNKIPSLYDSNDEWNLSELGTKNTYAVTDVDGKNKTEKILTITTAQATWQTDTTITNSQGQRYSPAACCCWRYSTLGTQQGDWYLPACGEMSIIVVNKTNINTKLTAINAEYSNDCINILENAHFLTSTEINSGTIFRVLADDGRVGSRGKYDNSTVIAVMQY